MSGEWDDLKEYALKERENAPPTWSWVTVSTDRILRLIAQAERAERLEQAMRQLIDQPHSSPHELLRAAMKGETP